MINARLIDIRLKLKTNEPMLSLFFEKCQEISFVQLCQSDIKGIDLISFIYSIIVQKNILINVSMVLCPVNRGSVFLLNIFFCVSHEKEG